METCKNFLLKLKNHIYNYLISTYTKYLYKAFLLGCDKNNTILDVGIGNAKSLTDNYEIIKSKNLKIVGIDIDEFSIEEGMENIEKKELENNVIIRHIDLFQLKTGDYELFTKSNKFDYIYFSNSYSVIPEPVKFLKFSLNFCKNYKNLIISQTLFNTPNKFYSYLKPKAKYFIFGIDFGRYLTHKQLNEELESEGLEIYSKERIIENNVCYIRNVDIYNIKIKVKAEIDEIPVEKGIFLEKNKEIINILQNKCTI